ncbi:aldo/keto reductase [Schlesneria paludicola]|uniref:aldo/keto reductase n=1 Tax=Schlesneria paludicola TaxID=360056 RepID=UPI00029A6760|nr:aldo/keto reductase [Schlesneria paludicola]
MQSIGQTGLRVPPLGFGTFKIGRNQNVKYPHPYELPGAAEATRLLNSILDLGCTLIDTAPAYGLSESRIGEAISHRRQEFVLSTKVGERFEEGHSTFDFSSSGVRMSVERSLRALKTDVLDIVLIHSNGEDQTILEQTDIVATLQELRSRGFIRAIGLSGKTVDGARLALKWADLLMIEYHLQDTSHAVVIDQAADAGVPVFVKKGLSSGRLNPQGSIEFVLSNPNVTSLIVGGMDFDHFRENWNTARKVRTI